MGFKAPRVVFCRGMNEYSILIRLLTRSGDSIGAAVDDMIDALGLPEDAGRHIVYQRLASLHELLAPLGLMIKHNPTSHVFYLDTSGETDSLPEEAPLSDRLAATLLVLITLSYQLQEWVPIDKLVELRGKSKRSVMEDLKELSLLGYVEMGDKKTNARPGKRVSFEIDYEKFFQQLSKNSKQD